MTEDKNRFRDAILSIAAIATILCAIRIFWPNTEKSVCIRFIDTKNYPIEDVFLEGPDGRQYPNQHGQSFVSSKLIGQIFTIHDSKTGKLIMQETLSKTNGGSKIIIVVNR